MRAKPIAQYFAPFIPMKAFFMTHSCCCVTNTIELITPRVKNMMPIVRTNRKIKNPVRSERDGPYKLYEMPTQYVTV